MMKKILSVCLIAAALFIAGEQAFCEDYLYALDVLTALGIVTEQQDDTLTRGEYAQMISNIFVDDTTDYSKNSFYDDVSDKYKYANAINQLAHYGIISTADKSFYPDREITQDEATCMLVRVLGYQLMAEREGGFPEGYNRRASMLGLFDGTSGETGARRMLIMLYNALEVNIMTSNYSGEYERSDTTLLADVMDTFVVRGRINAVGGTALEEGSEIAENKIRIADTVMYADSGSIKKLRELVGMEAAVYYTVNTDGENIYRACCLKNTDILEVPLDKLLSIDGDKIKYKNENESIKTVSLSSTVPNIIYNYRSATQMPALGKTGTMRLVSGDKGYDTVIVKDYRTYIASGFDRGELFTSYPEERSFKIEEYTVCELTDSEGYILNPENIAENTVLSVLESGDYMLEITTSDNVIYGKLSAIDSVEDSETKLLKINGTEYRTTEEFGKTLAAEGVNKLIGVNCAYYADVFGNIAYVESDGGYGLKVGYCTFVGYDWLADENEKIVLKVFTGENCFKRYNVYPKKGKYLIDGEYLEADAFVSQLENPQLIGYKIKNGAISEVETVASKQRDGLYRFSSTSSGRYNSSQGSFGAKVIIDSDAVIFQVPKAAEDTGEEKYYSVTRTKPWINATSYGSIEFYATTRDAVTSNVILWRRDYGGTADSKIPMMVEKSVRTLDEDENEVTRIYGWRNGSEFSLTAKPGADIMTANKTLGGKTVSAVTIGRGDIVIGAETPDVKTSYTQILYDCSEDKYLPSSNPYTANSQNYYIICGEITAKKDGVIKVKLRGSGNEEYYRIDAVTPILCADDEIRSASYLDADVGDTVVIYSSNGTANGVYIYK